MFRDLPEAVQKELVDMGLDYTYMRAKPTQRLCFLNIWAKMKTDGLWAWVAEVRFTTEPGQLDLHILDMDGFKRELTRRPDYTNPTRKFYQVFGNISWDSTSKDRVGQLHFKQFRGMESSSEVKAHIDAEGFLWELVQALRHLKHRKAWNDPRRARRALESLPATRRSMESITGRKTTGRK